MTNEIGERNISGLEPGTTYVVSAFPHLEGALGDILYLDATTIVAEPELTDVDINSTAIHFTISVDGQFDNVTVTIEPNFKAVTKNFVDSPFQFSFFDLTPGENYTFFAITKAGQFTKRTKQYLVTEILPIELKSQTILADDRILMNFINAGKGDRYVFTVLDGSGNQQKKDTFEFSQVFDIYYEPQYNGMSLKGEVWRYDQVKISNFVIGIAYVEEALFEQSDKILTVSYTTSEGEYEGMVVTIDPDSDPGNRTFTRGDAIVLDKFHCGISLYITFQLHYQGQFGLEHEADFTTAPCFHDNGFRSSYVESSEEDVARMVVTVGFVGDVQKFQFFFDQLTVGSHQSQLLKSEQRVEDFSGL